MSVEGEKTVSESVEVHDLADLQYLLMWQKEYVYNALVRAKEDRFKKNDLYALYSEIHGRNIFDDIEGRSPFPLSKECSGDQADFLSGYSDDLTLSIVVTSRNDTHVERMEDRTQVFIDSIYFLAEKFQAAVELIIVEWNPPANRPDMASAFSFPNTHAFVTTRILTIGQKLHDLYDWAEALPLYQMIAKNVGVRRARGNQILATNIDILFSEELFERITQEKLPSGKIYRSNRWDVDRSILDLETEQLRLNNARDLHFQVNYKEGIFPAGTQPVPSLGNGNKSTIRFENTNVYQLHTEACGDFQMLQRDDWLRVRGYSELDAYSFHLDSLFALTCHHAGLEEFIFEEPHYHIDHTLGVKVKLDSYEINEKKVINHISLPTLCALDVLQTRAKDFFYTNDINWGLAEQNIPDVYVTTADWDAVSPSQVNSKAGLPSSLTTLNVLAEIIDSQKIDEYLNSIWLNLKDFIEPISAKRSVHIWGAGKRGLFTGQALSAIGVKVNSYIHGGSRDTPPSVHGINIELADQFLQKQADTSFIIVASIFADDIVSTLKNSGRVEGVDYLVSI